MMLLRKRRKKDAEEDNINNTIHRPLSIQQAATVTLQ